MILPFLLLAGLADPSPVPAAPPAPRQEVAYPEDPAADAIPYLHLRRGALIESIAFSAAYLRAAPREDCIVLTSPPGTQLGGVAVYTKGDRLLLRSVTYGVVALPGLTATDINQPEKILAAMAAATAHAPRRAEAGAAESEEVQLQRAAQAVAFFPSALNEVTLARRGSDAFATAGERRVLVLDWNQRHYLWNPAVGVIEVPVPVDPLTHTPYLCVQQPELPGSMLFASEYLRLRPEEKAEVLIDPRLCANPLEWFARGVVVAAYTDRGRVGLHTGAENIPLPGATPADFADRAKLTVLALAYYHHLLQERGSRSGAAPPALIGDTNELQLRRAHFRLQVANARPGRIRNNYGALVIDCGDLQCAYAPGHGAAYSGWLPPYPALLVDGIAFGAEYLRAHPREKVVVVAHPPSGRLTYPQGGINAHVFYTRDGALWGHLGEDHIGEYPIPGAPAAAIDDRDQLLALCSTNPALEETRARAATALLGNDYRKPVAGLPTDYGASFGADAVLAQLRMAGVPCRQVPERARGEDGRVTEYPAAAVVFRWAGECFVYARQKVYRARACGYPSDLELP
jgi:hypothetical protein